MVENKTNKFLYIFAIVIGFFTLITGFVGSIIFNNFNVVQAEVIIPYEYVYLSNWTSHSADFSFSGSYCWTDGTDIYYSNSSTQKILDISTYTWSNMSWIGLSSFSARNVWTDGTDIFMSNGSTQRVLDISTHTWSSMFWTGLSSFAGSKIWTDGIDIYLTDTGNSYVLDISTHTWSTILFSNLPSNFNSRNVWTDGVNIYYNVAGSYSLVLDISTHTWSNMSWTGLSSFGGVYCWTDGINIYNSNDSNHYILDISTHTWSSVSFTGLLNFYGSEIFSTPDIVIFYSYVSATWYTLDREQIEPPEPPEPPSPESDYTQGYIDGYYDAYNDALTSGSDIGYQLGYNDGIAYATNMYSGYGAFLYSTWSIVDRNDYSIIRDDLTGRFTTQYFDKYNGGFINNVDFVNLVFDYEDNNPDDDNAMKIDFDNYLPLSQYNNVVTFNFLYGNELFFILDNGTTIYFDNDSVTKSISLDAYSNNSIVSIVVTFASSISDYGYFGLGFNSNYMVSYNNGFNDGYEKGHAEGNSSGYSLGKNKGYQEGLASANKYSFLSLFGAVVDAPINAITGLFNFTILGVNILELLTGLLTLLVVLVVVKFFLGR